MQHIVAGVDAYKPWSKNGTVVDPITEQPRLFPDKATAVAFCALSHYRGAQVYASPTK